MPPMEPRGQRPPMVGHPGVSCVGRVVQRLFTKAPAISCGAGHLVRRRPSILISRANDQTPGEWYLRPLTVRGSISMNIGRLPAAHGTNPSSTHSSMRSYGWWIS